MSKIKKIAAAGVFALGACGTLAAMKKINQAYRVELENCTDRPLGFYLGTKAAPDALCYENLAPGERRTIDLTRLPLLEHDVVTIRFPETTDCPGYQRTLIYDTDEIKSTMRGMIVDYGGGNYDVKLVKLG